MVSSFIFHEGKKKQISRPLYLLRYGVNLSILLTPGKEIK
jgi:hypothetical protein